MEPLRAGRDELAPLDFQPLNSGLKRDYRGSRRQIFFAHAQSLFEDSTEACCAWNPNIERSIWSQL